MFHTSKCMGMEDLQHVCSDRLHDVEPQKFFLLSIYICEVKEKKKIHGPFYGPRISRFLPSEDKFNHVHIYIFPDLTSATFEQNLEFSKPEWTRNSIYSILVNPVKLASHFQMRFRKTRELDWHQLPQKSDFCTSAKGLGRKHHDWSAILVDVHKSTIGGRTRVVKYDPRLQCGYGRWHCKLCMFCFDFPRWRDNRKVNADYVQIN